MSIARPRPIMGLTTVVVAATMVLLAACSSASSTTAEASSGSSSETARCAPATGGSGDATIQLSGLAFSDEATVDAGQSVTFTNEDGVGHTVTEGTNGTAASGACVDQALASGASLTVTFDQAGDYDITCKIHATMHTVVHVQ